MTVIDVSKISDLPGTETIPMFSFPRKGRDAEGRWHYTELIFFGGSVSAAYIDGVRAQISDLNLLEFPGEKML